MPRLPQTWLRVRHLLCARLTQGRGTNCFTICSAILGYQVSQAHLCSTSFPKRWLLGYLEKGTVPYAGEKSQPRFPFALAELGASRLQTQPHVPYAAGRAGSMQNNLSNRPFLQAILSLKETWALPPYHSRVPLGKRVGTRQGPHPHPPPASPGRSLSCQKGHLSFPQATPIFLNDSLGSPGP